MKMNILRRSGAVLPFALAGFAIFVITSSAGSRNEVLTGQAAFVSSTSVKPGLSRKITVSDLPKPFATESVATKSRIVPRPEGVMPQAPPGFRVGLFATGLEVPRVIRVAPNGDVFVVESRAGRVRVFRGMSPDGKPEKSVVFANGFHEPYGLVFYPAGTNPRWVYVANTDSVVRYPYSSGDLTAKGKAETVIADLPSSRPRDEEGWRAYDRAVTVGQRPPDHGHWTRDLAFSLDGKRLFWALGPRQTWTILTTIRARHTAPTSWNIRREANSSAFMLQAFAIHRALLLTRQPANCGARSTNAMA